VPVPAFGPRLVLGRQLADELLFASQRVRPAVLEDAGFAFHHPELDGALAAVLGG
jgi:NAD dependent epimerase/dehydratase family enzyme